MGISPVKGDSFLQYSNSSENDLCMMAKSGDTDAMAALFTGYAGFVRRKAQHFSGAVLEAEDIAQEGMLALLQAVRSYDSSGGLPFRPFAFACITNRMRTFSAAARAGKRRSGETMQYDDETFLDSAAGSVSLEDAFIRKELIEEYIVKIEQLLTPLEKKSLSLYLCGYSYKEAAKYLECSVKSVDNAVQRLRTKLKKLAKP